MKAKTYFRTPTEVVNFFALTNVKVRFRAKVSCTVSGSTVNAYHATCNGVSLFGDLDFIVRRIQKMMNDDMVFLRDRYLEFAN